MIEWPLKLDLLFTMCSIFDQVAGKKYEQEVWARSMSKKNKQEVWSM